MAALQSDKTLDPKRLAVIGGSHGGFLSCHMIGFHFSYDNIPTAETLAAMLQKSPITHAALGLELYKVLKSRGSPVRLLWFPEDGHSLSRVDTQVDCFLNTVLWLNQHL
ncbi:hypothetical protein GOODEAATRI_004255 [Goodea atripinnis]|uniref:Peptidase S9 prolyl oligopeptidase catalytic domain-containing protein n=1 Tax=Goodea atripinnis TaxID=208336 RepID=A0ABV0P1B9_9TELE